MQTAARAPICLSVSGIHGRKGWRLEQRQRSPWYATRSYERKTIWSTGRNRNSPGGVASSRSPSSRLPVWFSRSLRNSSFERRSSSFVALDAATSSWRACIISITCCGGRLSPPFGAIGPCLVLLIFLVLAGGTVFCIVPHDGRQMFLSVDQSTFVRLRESHAQESLCSVVLSFRLNTWKHKDKGRPRDCLHSDPQVNLKARKHQNSLTNTVTVF